MKRSVLAAFGLLVAGAMVQAGTVTLTFEGVGDNNQIGNFYNGGAGGNYGISFGPDALGLVSAAAGGSGNFSGNPSGDTIMYFLGGPGDVMNVAAGFTTGFSFFYSAVVFPGDVTVWSGLNGSGTELASIQLPVTPSGGSGCIPGLAYCPWFPVGVSFSGTAESVIFSGAANYIGFDNVTLGSQTPGVPEPATFALLGLGLSGLALARKKFRA